jgi:hypothetical protein
MSSIESGTIRTAFPNARYRGRTYLRSSTSTWWILTFVPRVHNGVRMGLRGVDESMFPIITPRLLGEDGRDSYRFRLPGHCGIFTVEMCAIHFACDLIESKPMGAYIILTDSLASIEGLKSIGISYRTNDMLFQTLLVREVFEISGGTWI